MAVEKKKKMGRPIKYTKEVVEKLADQLLEFLYEEPFPFLNKFATKHMLSVDVFSANKNFTENEYFSKALKIYKQTFVTILIEGAATGGLVPSMVIFTLKNIAGWRDTPLIDNSVHNHYTKVDVKINDNTKLPPTHKSGNRISGQEQIPSISSGT